MVQGHYGKRWSERRSLDPTDAGRGLTSDWVSQVKGTPSLDDDRVVEELVAPVQLREVRDPLAEQHRHEADTHLIHQAEVECLLSDLRARDGDIVGLFAAYIDLPRP